MRPLKKKNSIPRNKNWGQEKKKLFPDFCHFWLTLGSYIPSFFNIKDPSWFIYQLIIWKISFALSFISEY